MAITITTAEQVESVKPDSEFWQINAYSADATGNEEILAAASGYTHHILHLDMSWLSATESVTLNADATAVYGPVATIIGHVHEDFHSPLSFGSGKAIKIDAEGAWKVHAFIEGCTTKD